MYLLNPTKAFERRAKKLVKNNLELSEVLEVALELLEEDPRDSRLKSHKVIHVSGEEVFSSYVTDNIRLIWMCAY